MRLTELRLAEKAVRSAARRTWRWGNTTQWHGWKRTGELPEVSSTPSVVEVNGSPLVDRGVRAVACGSHHSALIDGAGDLYTFGSSGNGRLGHDGEGTEAQKVSLPEAVVSLSLGAYHSAAIGESGTLYTWGWQGSFFGGASGCGHADSSTEAPRPVAKLLELGEKIVEVACGTQHTIALAESGSVYAWGKGEFGRLGQGDTNDWSEPEEIEYFRDIVEAHPEQAIASVSAGAQWSAARTGTGHLYVWGRNDQGQLGLGEESMGDLYSSERYPRIVGILAQENMKMRLHNCGESHIVCIAKNGAVYSWGSRTWLEPRAITVPEGYETSLPRVIDVAAGSDYSLILPEDGIVYVLGKKSSGCLGQKEPTTARVPRGLPPSLFGNEKIVQIAGGATRCLAVTDPSVLVAASEEEATELRARAGPGVTVEVTRLRNFE
jgi:alpha-tubulin suppressor-like RCC1 family protein